MLDAVSTGSRKRGRDSDEPSLAITGFGEHRSKRLQNLPLRSGAQPELYMPSPPAFFRPISPPVGPQFGLQLGESYDSQRMEPARSANFDMDLDLIGTPVQSPPPPPPSPQLHPQMAAASLGPSSLEIPFAAAGSTLFGRLPTPIHPSFASQVRGHSPHAWTGPGPALKHLRDGGATGLGLICYSDPRVPRTFESNGSQWQAVNWSGVENRPLPSPISEGEDSPMSSFGQPPPLSLAGEVSSLRSQACLDYANVGPMDLEAADHQAYLSLSEFSHMDTSSHPHSHDHAAALYHNATALHTPPQLAADSQTLTAMPLTPGRKGHSRSRHTVNSWTWQPGMKKTFSIGYRADCEKCRSGVPGHFNHIVVS